ncbi:MAG: ABC transporter ATP-binding protein [Planctomycetales bacterium]|nr:ABC transporter ATP-binding protein [Planctomycetales bacterium]
MQNFLRALRRASQHWISLVVAAICSLGVAVLWGANIGAFYPILEVTIQGNSMQQWLDEEIQTRQAALDELESRLALGPQTEPEQRRLAAEQLRERAQLDGYRRMQPWVQAYVPSSPFLTIAWIVAALLLSTLVKHVFLIANELLVGRVSLDVARDLRMQIFDKALHMDRAGYAKQGTSGFTAQITHTTDMLSQGLSHALGAALREPLKILACLIGAGLICWRLLVLSVIVAPLVGFLLLSITRRLKRISRRILREANHFHEVMHESLENIQTVQAYRMQQHEYDKFGSATRLMRNHGTKFIFYSSLTKPVIEFLGVGMLGTTIVGGAYMVLNKETQLLGIPICDTPLSVSALLVFFGMLVGMTDPLRKLSAVYSSIYSATVAADAVYGTLDRSDRISDPQQPREVDTPHRLLTLQAVGFSYQPEQTILEDFSLEIPFGTTLGVVGHNGSGKSTLINLLCRFYDPTHGCLCLDGVDFRQLRVQDLRGRIALVHQHSELFNDTVAYNIRYGNLAASDAQVEQAARAAHAHEFITTALEAGYETRVGQGGQKLSGGQRQRIALARALLCNPEILILDEATSQIDMQSEQLIRESLAEHKGRRTMIMITHREKLLELADRVVELQGGQLLERATPHNQRVA